MYKKLLILILSVSGCASNKQISQLNAQGSQLQEEVISTTLVRTTSELPKKFTDNSRFVKGLNSWKITGAIAAKHKTQGWQARLLWNEQSSGNFSGRLYAYFSPEQAVIKGKPGQVTLLNEKGQAFKDSSIESMIKKSTGWQIPMDKMRFWVRGLRYPRGDFKATFDNESRLKVLKQQGWTILYKGYSQISGYVLPKKVELVHGSVRLRLVISKWTF